MWYPSLLARAFLVEFMIAEFGLYLAFLADAKDPRPPKDRPDTIYRRNFNQEFFHKQYRSTARGEYLFDL